MIQKKKEKKKSKSLFPGLKLSLPLIPFFPPSLPLSLLCGSVCGWVSLVDYIQLLENTHFFVFLFFIWLYSNIVLYNHFYLIATYCTCSIYLLSFFECHAFRKKKTCPWTWTVYLRKTVFTLSSISNLNDKTH